MVDSLDGEIGIEESHGRWDSRDSDSTARRLVGSLSRSGSLLYIRSVCASAPGELRDLDVCIVRSIDPLPARTTSLLTPPSIFWGFLSYFTSIQCQ